ncbi:MAG: ATP synthase F1 subunit epsilon [Bacilli bacterium]|nr:ATP synthase F1 subunit epsilon [Bacilli bacterium]
MSFVVRIITPKGLYAKLDASSLTVKLTTGYRTILKGHMDLVGALDIAPMYVVIDNNRRYYALHGGAINVTKDGVTLIVNAIESKDEIDVERAKASKERAETRLNSNDSNIDTKRAIIALKKSLVRIETSEK